MMNRDGAESGEQVLRAAVTAATSELGGNLAAAFALGSLAHGGFAPLVSDVDLVLILDPVDENTAARINRVTELAQQSCPTELAQRLSIFWTDWSGVLGGQAAGRLREIDRLDLLDSGRLLTGTDRRAGAVRPDGAELVRESATMAADRFDLEYLTQLNDPHRMAAKGVRPVTKAVLFPVRFLYTLRTHNIGHNDAAGSWYLHEGTHPDLVRAALRWRSSGLAESTEVAALLARHLVGLYDELFQAYIAELTLGGASALARRLRSRRAELAEVAHP